MRKVLVSVASFAVVLGGLGPAPMAQAAVEYTNKTTANGLGGNSVNSVYVVGSTVYAATAGSDRPLRGGSIIWATGRER